MPILIILLLFLLLGVLLPLLLPILTIVAVIAMVFNLRRMFSPTNYKRFNKEATGRSIFEEQVDNTAQGSSYEKDETTDLISKVPASVRDEKFWEQDHTVYDVPYEEAQPTDEDADFQTKD